MKVPVRGGLKRGARELSPRRARLDRGGPEAAPWSEAAGIRRRRRREFGGAAFICRIRLRWRRLGSFNSGTRGATNWSSRNAPGLYQLMHSSVRLGEADSNSLARSLVETYGAAHAEGKGHVPRTAVAPGIRLLKR